MLSFERVDPEDVPWRELDLYPDRTAFEVRSWLDFLVATQGGEPVVLRVSDEEGRGGWFTGVVVSRLGVRILGSPFQGWTTGPMGFNLELGIDRVEAMRGLITFAFTRLRCLHVEVMDRHLTVEQADEIEAEISRSETYEVDLSLPEDEVFNGMSSACRRAVRKSKKSGVRVEEASGSDFASEYFAQLEDVFAKQAMRPPYSVDRVRHLIDSVGPENLLLLRALDPDGTSIATGIFPYVNRYACFWGGASWRSSQALRPNEAVFWEAMQLLKQRGVEIFDLGGGGDYKRKYGGRHVERPFVRRARLPGMLKARNAAAELAWRWTTRRPRPNRNLRSESP